MRPSILSFLSFLPLTIQHPHPSTISIPNSLALRDACANTASPAVTANGIVLGQCRPMTLLFARGSSEGGNMGGGVGPPFARALRALLGADEVVTQGVNDYPALFAESQTEGGSPSGGMWMAEAIAIAKKNCPKTFLVLSGYSQGAMVAHKAATNISTYGPYIAADLTSFISAVAVFGDPDRGQPVGQVPQEKVVDVCHDGDGYCQHDGSPPPYATHLTYCKDVAASAEKILTMSGLKGTGVDFGWCG